MLRTMTRRDFGRLGGTVAISMAMAGRGLSATPAVKARDSLDLVDSELRPLAREIQRRAGQFPVPTDKNLPGMRAMMKSFRRAPLSNVPQMSRRVRGSTGAPDVTLYIINAKAGVERPAIVHMHGGGFVTGAARDDVRNLQELAAALDCVIVSVDYRLAPETDYRGSLEDNYAGLKWTYAHATEIGVDPKRIAVMGESAGGGHAALLAITARDRGEVPVLFQSLVYPMLDDRTGSGTAIPDHIGKLIWTTEANRYGWQSFLGQSPGGQSVPDRAVPARRTDLTGLPPTFIGVGALDLFVGEDVEYARRLIEAAVPTELLVIPGAFHGFDTLASETSIAKRFTDAKQMALRRAFAAVATM